MWLALSFAFAVPPLDDLDGWEQLLEAAADGPDGCWDVTGDVHWTLRTNGGRRNEGRAGFEVRFDGHRFGTFTLLDPDVQLQGCPGLDPDDLTLQFRPVVGRTGRWWVLDDDLGVYVRDHEEGERTVWIPTASGTIWVTPLDDGGVKVARADAIGDRAKAPEATTWGIVPAGSAHVTELHTGREPHFQRSGSQHRSANEVRYGPDGLPLSEARHTEFRFLGLDRTFVDHELQFTRWTPCGPDEAVALAAAPIVPRDPAHEVLTPASASKVPRRTVALAPEREAKRQELLFAASRHRREARRELPFLGLTAGLWGLSVGLAAARDIPLDAREMVLVHSLAGAGLAFGGGQIAWHLGKAGDATRAAEELQTP